MGGVNAFERPLNSVERLDVTQSERAWRSVAPLPRALCDAAAAVIENRVYVCGGRTSLASQSAVLGCLYEYDVDTGTLGGDGVGRWGVVDVGSAVASFLVSCLGV